MPYFRKKPLTVRAVRFTGANIDELWETFDAGRIYGYGGHAEIFEALLIMTPEGEMRAEPGDWVAEGVKGELYPIKDDILRLSYDPVSDPPFGNLTPHR